MVSGISSTARLCEEPHERIQPEVGPGELRSALREARRLRRARGLGGRAREAWSRQRRQNATAELGNTANRPPARAWFARRQPEPNMSCRNSLESVLVPGMPGPDEPRTSAACCSSRSLAAPLRSPCARFTLASAPAPADEAATTAACANLRRREAGEGAAVRTRRKPGRCGRRPMQQQRLARATAARRGRAHPHARGVRRLPVRRVDVHHVLAGAAQLGVRHGKGGDGERAAEHEGQHEDVPVRRRESLCR